MKATLKFYAKPDKGQQCEVVPVLVDNNFDGECGVNLRLLAMGDVSGEMHVRMSNCEALSLAAEIVIKIARSNAL